MTSTFLYEIVRKALRQITHFDASLSQKPYYIIGVIVLTRLTQASDRGRYLSLSDHFLLGH